MSFGTTVAELRHYAAPARRERPRLLDLLVRFESWLDARESRRTLQHLDDRSLADLGLSRSDVERPDAAASWQGLLLPQARR